MMSRSFILLQLIGWLLFGAINFFSRALLQGGSWAEFISTSVLVLVGLFVSSVLRRFYHLSKVLSLPPPMLTLTAFGASIIAGICITLLVFIIFEPFAEALYNTPTLFTLMQFVSNIINLSLVMLIWSALYFAIKRYHRFEQIKAEKQQLDDTLKQVSLEALINQLNPHFMFNTINNIRALILEDANRARDMLSHLADMYRYTLNSNNNHLVTLADELTMIEDYLALMDIQLEGRLQTEFDIQRDTREAFIPRMMLQLLVENAIKYGIANKKQGGQLCLVAKRQEHSLFLQVRNSGKIQKSAQDSTGMGLNNIQQRLALLYADNATITMTEQDEQVVVNILLPWSTSDDTRSNS
ncbi:sensor histidine kinase [Aliiglaciecola lipolytica]|uniref:sensor histidine kinase n=1 Tax=Aliiglaciecola lipolytica TaxID=477689 RepID=UPI001C09F113|nr:histidine kinase [Aliiglaciecola lipolytica]MBU2878130.1 histidine kinase [Aliiglaciecola lipolytica]